MTKKRFWVAMLVMVLAFGMTVVGCDLFGDKDNDPPKNIYRPDLRPYLSGYVSLDNYYPVVSGKKTITASFRKYSSSSDPIGTPSWRWYKTTQNASYLEDVTNKTSLGSGTTYTVDSLDVGYYIWAEVSYSGNIGTSSTRTYDVVLSNPSLPGYVSLDIEYPVIGETITASLSSSSSAIGTPSWRWYKTTQDAHLEDVTNKTSLGSGTTYTVKQNDQGYWIWAAVSYSGNSGTRSSRTSSPVIGIPATAAVSVSVEAVRYLSSYPNNHFVTITLTLSDGRWNNVSYNTASQWLTITGSPSASEIGGWEPSVSVEGQKLVFSYRIGYNTTQPISLTVALNTARLSTMRSNTNVYNTLTAGSPSSVTVSQWTIK